MKSNSHLKLIPMTESPESRTSDDKVPLIAADLPSFEELEGPFREILDSRKISNFGKYNAAFEAETAKYIGCAALTVSSGTMGLLLSLQALGVKPGDEVALPSFTFMATAQAVLYAGATPVFIEISPNMTVSPRDLEVQLSARKKITAVIGVHTYGLPAAVDEIKQIVDGINKSQKREIKVLYDAAHAFGSAKAGSRVGNFGDAEVFSLSVTKALVSVEGGMITSHNVDFINRIKKMRNYGIESNYDAHYAGMNGKMSEFHAAVGLLNIKNLDQVLATRLQKSGYYRQAIETKTGFKSTPTPKDVVHTYKDFSVFVPSKLSGKRDEVCRFLSNQGIENRAYFFPPVHEQEFFRRFHNRSLPETERLSRLCITLPFFTTITERQMDRVVKALADAEKSLT